MTFLYLNNFQMDNKDVFYALLPEHVRNEQELFVALAEQLQFPDYFGFNWNAVYDCFCDFEWISKYEIVLVHQDLTLIDVSTLKTYIEVLIDAKKLWASHSDEHIFKVFFHKNSEYMIENLIKEINP